MELNNALRRELKARAHPLEPVVTIGTGGLTEAVLAEIDRALNAHELIKIRANAERAVRATMLDEIARRLSAAAVQHIGKILVVYRARPADHTQP